MQVRPPEASGSSDSRVPCRSEPMLGLSHCVACDGRKSWKSRSAPLREGVEQHREAGQADGRGRLMAAGVEAARILPLLARTRPAGVSRLQPAASRRSQTSTGGPAPRERRTAAGGRPPCQLALLGREGGRGLPRQPRPEALLGFVHRSARASRSNSNGGLPRSRLRDLGYTGRHGRMLG